MKAMAVGEVEGLTYGGWLPVNSQPNNPSFVSVDKPPIPTPETPGLDFPYLEAKQEEINRYRVSRPLNPWQQSNLILDRQQEGGFPLPFQFPLSFQFPLPLQLSPRDIALGGIVLSLLVTAVIGQIYVFSHQIFLVMITEEEEEKNNKSH